MDKDLIDYLLFRIDSMESEILKLQIQNELLTAKLLIAKIEKQNG